ARTDKQVRTDKQALTRRAEVTTSSRKDRCVFGLITTSEIRGYSNAQDYKYCGCQRSGGKVLSTTTQSIQCLDGRTVNPTNMMYNALEELDGYEKTDSTPTCNFIWEPSELIIFTASDNPELVKQMCTRVDTFMPEFNSKVRAVINGPKNLDVIGKELKSFKRQMFLSNFPGEDFNDSAKLKALKQYMNKKEKAYSDIKSDLSDLFGQLEQAEQKKGPVLGLYRFQGIQDRFNKYFDGGTKRRQGWLDLLTKMVNSDSDTKEASVRDMVAQMSTDSTGVSSYTDAFVKTTGIKVLENICKAK
ncbi:hypothetical protein EC988_003458, partial [Linderina pennispora]